MSSKKYSDQLRDPRWQRKRLEVLSRENFRCQECYSTERTLHVHHVLYRRDALPWEYADNELIVLCETCHESWHEDLSALTRALGTLTHYHREELIGYAEALHAFMGPVKQLRTQIAALAASEGQRPVGAIAALFAANAPMEQALEAFRELFSQSPRSIDDPWVFALGLIATGFEGLPGGWSAQFWHQFAAQAKQVRLTVRGEHYEEAAANVSAAAI